MHKKYLVIGIALLIIGSVAALAYFHKKPAPQELKSMSEMYTLGEYGYRCGDGTEFTMLPAYDMSTLLIVPATSVERIPRLILTKVASSTTARYQGEGVTFVGKGETVHLSSSEFETTCTPMHLPDEAPFNFGDGM